MYITRLSWCIFVLAALLVPFSESQGDAINTERDRAADSIGKSLASLFLVKEETAPAARNSMGLFQALTRSHIQQNAAAIKAQHLAHYERTQILEPTAEYLSESLGEHLQGLFPDLTKIENAVHPDPEYLTDPAQNVVKDFFNGATRSGTSVGSVSGPNVITSAPCFVSNTATGVSLSANGISISPALVNAIPYGVGVLPQGINIQPALVQIKPYGIHVAPAAVDIVPQLISITPDLESIGGAGVAVSPKLIHVKNRRILGTSGDRDSSFDQLYMQSYETWMQLTADIILGSAPDTQDAIALLSSAFARTEHYLNTFEKLSNLFEGIRSKQGLFNETQDAMEALEEFSQLYPIEILKVLFNGSLHDPRFDATSLLPMGVSFTDPQFFSDSASNVSSSSKVFSVASSFINYAPCIFSSGPAGVAVSPVGISISPTGILISPKGVALQPRGINIQPSLVYVVPVGENITPHGVQITPVLIDVAPRLHSIGHSAISVSDALVTLEKGGTPEIG